MTLLPGEKEAILTTAETLSESADASARSRWICGVIFPLAPAAAGLVYATRAGSIWLQSETWSAIVRHDVVKSLGPALLLLSAAVFMHTHFFWTPHPRWHFAGWLGKNAAALVFAAVLLLVAADGVVGIF